MGCNPIPNLEGAPATLGSCIRGLPSSSKINPGWELGAAGWEEGALLLEYLEGVARSQLEKLFFVGRRGPEKVRLAGNRWPGDAGSWDGDPQPGPPCARRPFLCVVLAGSGR